MIKVESRDSGTGEVLYTVHRDGSGAAISAELEALITEILNDGMPVGLLDVIVARAKRGAKIPVECPGKLDNDCTNELVGKIANEILDILNNDRGCHHDD